MSFALALGTLSFGDLLEYCHLIANPKTWATWTHFSGNELGQLAQGMLGQVTRMDTIFYTPKDKVPRARAKDITYGLITSLIRPEKTDEPNRTRLVAGGDRVYYPFNAGTPTANLLTLKLLINSMISTPRARFFTMDIKNFYLCTPMTRYKYMQLKLSNMPDDVIAKEKDIVDSPSSGIMLARRCTFGCHHMLTIIC
jgi:hypothetical protein